MSVKKIDWIEWFKSANNDATKTPKVVIAEGGINHNGSLELACELIEMASRAGANIIKFQKREPEICVPEKIRNKIRQTPWGEMTYFEYKKRIEFTIDDYKVIDKCAEDCGIDWFVSAWDIPSQILMREFESPINKVASAMLTHLELLELIASEKKPTFISTGMSTLDQIDRAVSIFENANCDFILMHTVSTYPAKDEDLNLNMIKTLSDKYGRAVGYSGHETTVSPSVVAAALGAVAIERHVTLDRASWGTDQAASLEESGLSGLVSILNRLPFILGDGVKRISDAEMRVAENLRYWQ